jgi:hypothetical protein
MEAISPRAVIEGAVLSLFVYALAIVRRSLRNGIEYVVQGALFFVSPRLAEPLVARLSLRRYARLRLAGTSQYLVVPSATDVQLKIDRVFVPLTLEQATGLAEEVTHADLLAAGDRIRVIGDPGSGKSSLSKRLFRDACNAALAGTVGSRLPVLLELKNLDIPPVVTAEHLGKWLLASVESSVTRTAAFRAQDCFRFYLRRAGVLLLLDGLDEVATPAYPRVRDALRQLSELLSDLGPQNVLVLTMRTQFHQRVRADFSSAFPTVFRVRPFSLSDMHLFLMRWPYRDQRGERPTRIYEELSLRPSLRDLCRNPLVLSMYVAQSEASRSFLTPESRTEFYATIIEELVGRRRAGSTLRAEGAKKLREQRRRVLGALAYEHMLRAEESTNTLRWDEALHLIQVIMGCDEDEADSVLWEMAKETGLVGEEREHETLRFIHLTVCEFLAASEAANGAADGWERLVAQHRNFVHNDNHQLHARLVEVIPFACALLRDRPRQASALRDVADVSDNRLLAQCLFETKAYELDLWSTLLDQEAERLRRVAEPRRDDEWLRDLQLFNALVRDANASAAHSRRIRTFDAGAFFRSLAAGQTRGIPRLLEAYAFDDAAAAFQLAATCGVDLARDLPELVVSSCDQRPFFALAYSRAEHGPDSQIWLRLLIEAAVRSSAVRELLENLDENAFDRARKLPRRKQWFGVLGIRENAFVRALSLALAEPGDSPSVTRALHSIAAMRRPAEYRVILGSAWLAAIAVAAGLAPLLGGNGTIATVEDALSLSATVSVLLGLVWLAHRLAFRVAFAQSTETKRAIRQSSKGKWLRYLTGREFIGQDAFVPNFLRMFVTESFFQQIVAVAEAGGRTLTSVGADFAKSESGS